MTTKWFLLTATCPALLLSALLASEVLGQQNATAVSPQGAAVQLPTFSYFGAGTTVSVPDRGSTYLGGVNRSAEGRREFGLPFRPFGNRAIGGSSGTSNARVSVYVHDFEAMDEYLLSQPTAFRRTQASAETSARPATSVDELRARHAREEQAREAKAVELVQRARAAEAAGRTNVARIYYRMAASRATGPLKTEIAARLGALDGSTAMKLAEDR